MNITIWTNNVPKYLMSRYIHTYMSSFWTNIMLDCYRSCFDVLWNNWMTNALAYFLEWTIFASHTEVTARGWTLAGWCRVLSSQCTSIHLMIHQCHLDLFVKCSHRMRSNIILQWYGTSVILNTSLTNNTIRWWSSYTITVTEQDYISLYQRVMDMSSYRPMGASVARLIILISGARSWSWNWASLACALVDLGHRLTG